MKFLINVFIFFWSAVLFSQTHTKNIDFNQLSLQFENASAELKPEYLPLVYRLADTLIKNPEMQVTVRGHVCCVKRNVLAKKRAKVVRNYLYYFGVKKEQVTILGMKNTMPVVFPEKTKEDELINMRVDFILQ